MSHCNCSKKKHNKDHKKSEFCYDYVIVGAGTAGCALAQKLSDPVKGKYKRSVLVLEAGENLSNDPAVLGNNLFIAQLTGIAEKPLYSKVYQALLTEDGAQFNPYSDGRMWGGSSGHNGLQAYRGAPKQYNEWATLTGETAWTYDNLKNNVMKPFEHYEPDGTLPNTTQRGLNGPLFITQEPPLDTDPFLQEFAASANAPFVTDLNDPDQGVVGTGAAQDWVTPPFVGTNSIRSFAANAYLTGTYAPDATNPPTVIPAIVDENGKGLNGRKLRVLSSAFVNKVTFDKCNNARGVEFVILKEKEKCKKLKATERCKKVLAKKEIILCAGTIQDAAILQRSGVGDADLLADLGIPVVYANSNVGQNIENHYGSVAVMSGTTIDIPRTASAFVNLSATPPLPAPYLYPDVDERLMQFLGINAPFLLPSGIANVLGITSGVSMVNFILSPKSIADTYIISRDPLKDPELNLNLYSDGDYDVFGTDANKVVTWFKVLKTMEINSGGTYEVLYPTPTQYLDDAELFQAALDTNLFTTYHTSGSCRMGFSATDAVCDGKLRVFGVKRLRVADNAASPVIETGNTAYQAFVIGLQAARFILGQ